MDGRSSATPSAGTRSGRLRQRVAGFLIALGSGVAVALAVLALYGPRQPVAQRATATERVQAAATVDGFIISMAVYHRQVLLYQHLYSGPRAAHGSLAAATIRQHIEDRAVDQAIGDYLIVREARRRQLVASPRDVSRTLAGLILAAGGATQAHAKWGLSMTDLRRVATLQVLNLRLVSLSHDRYWMEHAAAVATVVYFVGSRAGRAPDMYPAGDPGHPAPAFVAVDLAGHTTALANLAGSPVVLTLWNVACITCLSELALLQQFAQSHHDVRVIALDEGDSVRAIRTYVRGMAITFSIWRDPDSVVQDLYASTGLPSTYFVDPTGTVRDMNIGPMIDAATINARAASIMPPSP